MRRDKRYLYGSLISFIIPLVVAFLSYASLGIYPGGDKLPISLDLKSEHLAYFNYLNTLDDCNNSIFFQSMGGLGGSTIGSMEMYCGPFFLISRFFDIKFVPYVIEFLIVFLTGLCGLFEFVYLTKGFPAVKSLFGAALLSSCYALSSCSIVFFIVPVWLIGILMLPIVALSLDLFLEHNKIRYLVISLALTIVLNYYVSYIIIYFLVLYFIYRSSVGNFSIKTVSQKAISLFFAILMSVCISAFSWFPALLELLNGKGVENRTPVLGLVRNPLSILSMMFPLRYSGLNRYDQPYLYCGIFAIVLFFLYFFKKSINKREKIASAFLIIYLFLSFSVGLFDISWMFFAEPNGYPSRYSFVFSFALIFIGSKSIGEICLYTKQKLLNVLIKPLISFFVISELFFNARYILDSIDSKTSLFANAQEYFGLCDTMQDLKNEFNISDSFSRTVKNWNYACNDGILFGYQDIDYFSSSYNSSVHEFLGDLGLNEKYHLLKSSGITPPVASILGVSKLVWYGSPLNDYRYLGSLNGLDVYENESCISFAFATPETDEFASEEFGDNPFGNINKLIKDFSGVEGVFEIETVNVTDDYFSVYVPEGKELWVYLEPFSDSSEDIHDGQSGLKYIYYDGYPIATYSNDASSYCVKLGAGAGDEVYFTYDGILKTAYAAVYNPEKAIKAFDAISNMQASGFAKTKNGFGFYIDLPLNSDIIITYPFEKGYEIYVDGIKTDYYSYRNALIRLKLEAGEHIISVEYHPPGLKLGIAISLLSVIICLILLNFSKIRPKN